MQIAGNRPPANHMRHLTPATSRSRCLALTALVFVAVPIACQRARPAATATGGQAPTDAATVGVAHDTLLESAVDLLLAPTLSPESYLLTADRLNQFIARYTEAGHPIQLAPDLKADLEARLEPPQMERLLRNSFDVGDGLHLATCFLARDIADRLTQSLRDDLEKAVALFEWTIRNLTIKPESSGIRVSPLFVLVGGTAHETERAWAFMTLLRQVGIDSAILAVRDKSQAEDVYLPWAVAVLVAGELHLFDATWGVAIPGPGGKGVATLNQAAGDAAVLAQLDIDSARPYRVHSGDLERVAVYLESTPAYWAPRMHAVQDRLAGVNRVHLTVELQAIAARFRTAVGMRLRDIELWQLPIDVDELPRKGDPNFRNQLLEAVGPVIALPTFEEGRRAHLRGDWERAIQRYLELRDPASSVNVSAQMQEFLARAREDVTFFMGQVQFDQGNFGVARDWFAKRYLDKYPTGRWATAAPLCLATCADRLHESAEMVKQLESPITGPQAFGNLVRARLAAAPLGRE